MAKKVIKIETPQKGIHTNVLYKVEEFARRHDDKLCIEL